MSKDNLQYWVDKSSKWAEKQKEKSKIEKRLQNEGLLSINTQAEIESELDESNYLLSQNSKFFQTISILKLFYFGLIYFIRFESIKSKIESELDYLDYSDEVLVRLHTPNGPSERIAAKKDAIHYLALERFVLSFRNSIKSENQYKGNYIFESPSHFCRLVPECGRLVGYIWILILMSIPLWMIFQ